MAFVKHNNGNFNIGDKGITTKRLENFSGYFEIGTKVTVTGITERGYDLVDDEGNRITETGFDSIERERR